MTCHNVFTIEIYVSSEVSPSTLQQQQQLKLGHGSLME